MDMKASPTLTIVIPTCYGGSSLIKSVRSIFATASGVPFKMIVMADSRPIENDILQELRGLGVRVIENPTPGSQQVKLNQLTSLCETDIVVSTQDDVRFAPNTLRAIQDAFRHDGALTLVGVNVKPEPATSFFGKVVQVGNRLTEAVAVRWNKGDNYLLANGRCLAVRVNFLRAFAVPNNVINGDAYYYFANRARGGTFQYVPEAVVYNKSPEKLREHISQTKRFSYSLTELTKYFGPALHYDYAIPRRLLLGALSREWAQHPLLTTVYCGVNAYCRLVKKDQRKVANPLWNMNQSTKLS